MSLTTDVRKMVRKETEKLVKQGLDPAEEKAPIEGGIGKGVAAVGSGSTGSNEGGAAQGLITETDVDLREYYAEQIVSSSDGLFQLSLEPIKKIVFEDATGAEATQIYKEKIF